MRLSARRVLHAPPPPPCLVKPILPAHPEGGLVTDGSELWDTCTTFPTECFPGQRRAGALTTSSSSGPLGFLVLVGKLSSFRRPHCLLCHQHLTVPQGSVWGASAVPWAGHTSRVRMETQVPQTQTLPSAPFEFSPVSPVLLEFHRSLWSVAGPAAARVSAHGPASCPHPGTPAQTHWS